MTDGPPAYGAYPQPSPVDQPGPVDKGPVPPAVRYAVILMVVNAVIGVIAAIVLFATKDTVKNQIRKDNPDWTNKRVDDAANVAVTVGSVVALVIFVLFLLLAWQVWRGKQWARIVVWVFAGLGALSALGSLAQDESGASHALGVVSGILDIATIALLIVGGRTGYFRGGRQSYGYDAAGYPPPGSYPPPPPR